MNGSVDVQHGGKDTALYRELSMGQFTVYRRRGLSRSALCIDGMGENSSTNLVAAFERVLDERKEVLRSKHAWAKRAGLTDSTARGAFANKNPTVDTLTKLAEAAGLTLAELLEYGDPDWEVKRRARDLVRHLGDEQLRALESLLVSRLAGPGQ